jgi:hypothetical protein
MTKLKELDLGGAALLRDISAVRNMPELGALRVSHTDVRDISALAGLAKLGVVELAGTRVKDFKPLMASAKSHKLIHLIVSEGTDSAAYADLQRADPDLEVHEK